jgi:hypothetical protein
MEGVGCKIRAGCSRALGEGLSCCAGLDSVIMPQPPRRTVRRFPRIRSEHPVRAVVLGGASAEEFGATRVIGLGGCSFLSPRSFGVETLLELQIPLSGGVVTADARVVYELPETGGELEVGVEFLRVPPRHLARLKALLARATQPLPVR